VPESLIIGLAVAVVPFMNELTLAGAVEGNKGETAGN